MLDIQEDKKLQLEKIALKKGWPKRKFDNKLKSYVEDQGEVRTAKGRMENLNQAFNQLAYELGVYSDWEGDQDPQSVDMRLRDPNYKSMYVSGNAQGGRIGFAGGTSIGWLLKLLKGKSGTKKGLEKIFREGPITTKFLDDFAKTGELEKFIRTRDMKGPHGFGLYEDIAEMPAGLQAAEFIKNIRIPGKNAIDYGKAEMYIGKKLKGNEPIDDLIEMYADTIKTEFKSGGGRIGYDVGGREMLDMMAQQEFSKNWEDLTKNQKEYIMKLGNRFSGAAQGGRIGYEDGKGVMMAMSDESNTQLLESLYEEFLGMGFSPKDAARKAQEAFDEMSKAPGRDRVMAQEGGLMDLGGMEKDYRQEGGFVPIGGKEKADDVPARLSKNEFVFTADAVRNAGGGDIDAGAQVMENLMENLEAGGKVSEESQGLEGAREMFANAQQLQNRII